MEMKEAERIMELVKEHRLQEYGKLGKGLKALGISYDRYKRAYNTLNEDAYKVVIVRQRVK